MEFYWNSFNPNIKYWKEILLPIEDTDSYFKREFGIWFTKINADIRAIEKIIMTEFKNI